MNRQTATLDTSGMTALQKEEIYDMINAHYDTTKMPLIYEIDTQNYDNFENDRIDEMTLEFLKSSKVNNF